MVVTTTYTAENKRERLALKLMSATLTDSGLEVEFDDEHEDMSKQLIPASLSLTESRRRRKGATP
jgi:hypothetical protein